MFLNKKFIFLEAEEDAEEANKYTMDDAEFEDVEEPATSETNATEGSGDETNEQEQSTMDEQDTQTMDDGSTDAIDNTDTVSSSDVYKKYILIKEYKNLLTNIINIDKSLDYLKRKSNNRSDVVDFILDLIEKNEQVKIKINFYLKNNFINNSYEDSLTNYLFFKKEFESILEILDKLVNDLNQ